MKKFAFLIHPRDSLKEDLTRVNPLFHIFPEKILKFISKYFRPFIRGKVVFTKNNEVIGWIIVIPLSAEQFLTYPRDFVIKKIIQGIKKAEKLGAEIIGLGEFTSSITHAGEDLVDKTKSIIVNGKSLTAGTVFYALKKISQILGINLKSIKIGIVGAGGATGTAVSLLLAEEGCSLILCDKNSSRLEMLSKKILSLFPENNLEIIYNLNNLRKADIVVVVTSAVEQIIKPEHLKENALVYDITQPRNTSPIILKQRKDVIIIDGGIISMNGINYGMDIGLKPNYAYACLVETMLIALEEKNKNLVGTPSIDDVKEMLKLMEKYSNYFQLAPFESFGNQINFNKINH